jgi:uncharacterized membrane protein
VKKSQWALEESAAFCRNPAMADADQPTTHRRRPWALTFFSLVAVGGLISMPFLAGEAGKAEMPDIVRFLGHFHPVVLHLPIGVFALLLFQEIGRIFSGRKRDEVPVSLFPMFFGAASAIVAVIAGFLLYHGHADDYSGNDLAERHLWGGLVFAVAAVLTFIVQAWTVALAGNPAWFRLLLFGSVGVMGITSHDGASMTHGSDFLTRYAPEPLRKILGGQPKVPEVPKDEPVAVEPQVYASIVAPILERRCVECHKEGKTKGKFRMDTFELLVKGGKEGPGLIPGNAAESNILVRINLPEDDDEHMPPEGKPDLNEDEVKVLTWWINEGADPVRKLSDFQVPADLQPILAKLADVPAVPVAAGDDKTEPEPAGTIGPDEALKASVATLAKEFPGALSFESQQSAALTFTAVSLRGKMDDETFVSLSPVLPHLATLDLSATNITDKSVSALESATKLRMVRLSETRITDASIDTLAKLPELESVNFYGTKVTDAGVMKLSTLPKLKRLYLWQTPVTPEGVKALKEKMPNLEVITGS